MAPTRATRAKAGKSQDDATTSRPTLKQLEGSVQNPPHVFVLPRDTSANARIATIPNPATLSANRYLVCPDKGFYEFTRVAAPNTENRSWLLEPKRTGRSNLSPKSDLNSMFGRPLIASEAEEADEETGAKSVPAAPNSDGIAPTEANIAALQTHTLPPVIRGVDIPNDDESKDQADFVRYLQQATGLRKASKSESDEDESCGAYVIQAPNMFVATPIDPLFLLLPSLFGDSNTTGQEYLAASDFIADLSRSSPQLTDVLATDSDGKLDKVLQNRVELVCESMDMGDETMYALSLPKLVKALVCKAQRMTANGLPASMEERFVTQALDVPVLSIKREESSVTIHSEDATSGTESQVSSGGDSQTTNASDTTSASVSTAATSVSVVSMDASNTSPPKTADLLRLKVALNFILSSYILPKLRRKMEPLLSDPRVTGVDFSALEEHLDQIASLKREAQALRSLSDNISRKRANEDDDEVAAGKAEKKRKKEEEDARKKNISQGVKKLAKADTSGMKKMSSFFSKALAKK